VAQPAEIVEPLEPATLTDMLDGGWKLLRERPGTMLGLSAVCLLPAAVLEGLAAASVDTGFSSLFTFQADTSDTGLQVAGLLATDLGLALPDLPWHAERDRIAASAAVLGVTAGAMAKIAQDVVLLAQTEVGEVAEASAPGKGGSSAMPQKRNAVGAILGLAAARLALAQVPLVLAAMVQEHERAAGGWQAEWAALPSLFCYTGGSVAHVAETVQGLRVDTVQMRANLDRSGGLVMAEALTMALALHLGRLDAQRLVQAVCGRAGESDLGLEQVVHEDPQICAVLSTAEIDRALDPDGYMGSADALIDRALASYHAIHGGV
jgi:3-carboxy-cis,cis-muconate cycloisomerase